MGPRAPSSHGHRAPQVRASRPMNPRFAASFGSRMATALLLLELRARRRLDGFDAEWFEGEFLHTLLKRRVEFAWFDERMQSMFDYDCEQLSFARSMTRKASAAISPRGCDARSDSRGFEPSTRQESPVLFEAQSTQRVHDLGHRSLRCFIVRANGELNDRGDLIAPRIRPGAVRRRLKYQ